MFLDAVLLRWPSNTVRRMKANTRTPDWPFIYMVPKYDHFKINIKIKTTKFV